MVFSRWMKTVDANLCPPVGASSDPTTSSRSQGIAPGATKSRSEEAAVGMAQTVLVSCESCHVGRIIPSAWTPALVLSSKGLGLKKWVMICLLLSLNKVACGVKSIHAKPEVLGHMGVLGFGHGKQM